MQVPVLSGISADENAEFRTSYPVNLIPVPKESGLSNGFLRPADGILLATDDAPGIDRGGVVFNGVHYRVLGTKLCSVAADYTIAEIGDIPGSNQARFAYSVDRLCIVGGGNAYYLASGIFSQLSDPDLGTVFDVVFVDGYFMFTDGTFLIVTELANPAAIDPLKYGSAEANPDSINALHLISNEVHAIGERSIEVFDNTAADNFPFERIEGAQVDRGSLGRNASCTFDVDRIAMLGSGLNETPSVYMCANAQSVRIATREIDKILKQYTPAQLSAVAMESRFDEGHQHLLIHLPDRTLVYDASASAAAEEPVWFVLTSAIDGFSPYLVRNLIWAHGKWVCGHPDEFQLGELTLTRSDHYGEPVRWEFGTVCIYNDGLSGIVHEVELVALTGRTAEGVDPRISTSYSKDGMTWSMDKSIRSGLRGQRRKRLVWRLQGTIGHFRMQRFTGDSDSFMSFARIEMQIEPLSVGAP